MVPLLEDSPILAMSKVVTRAPALDDVLALIGSYMGAGPAVLLAAISGVPVGLQSSCGHRNLGSRMMDAAKSREVVKVADE